MKLSIIIPFYNAEPYTSELLSCLGKQMTEEAEIIVVDDGSIIPFNSDIAKVIRKENGGPASARNVGLDNAKGEYISFIDADDLVAGDFIQKVLEKTEKGFDVLDFSWRSIGSGTYFDCKITSKTQKLNYPSVCTRVFKRSFIGKVRFNENKDACEDEEFSRRLGYLDDDKKFKREIITDYMYFYRTNVNNSNTKRYKQGLYKTKRIVYYYNHVTADMTDLLEEIKKEDKHNEVWLLTNQNDIPELKNWCQIRPPFTLWTHFLRGEKYNRCEIISPPIYTQVVLYMSYLHVIGGIETFIYNFVLAMSKYDITIVADTIPDSQFNRLSKIARIIKKPNRTILCDTLILLRILDEKPQYIESQKVIRTVHACRTNPKWYIPDDCDLVVHCSTVSKESFGSDGIVIHNPFHTEKKKALFLISATRIPAPDKGKNEWRMMRLAQMLNHEGIPFIWLNFSEGKLDDPPRGFFNMGIDMDIQPYIAKADYLVQLSDSEGYSYSILEALTNNTAVICTPFQSAAESGVKDGENGYIVPFDMGFDVKKLLKVPKFKDDHSNDEIIASWSEILGKPMKKTYNPNQKVKIRATREYTDTELNRFINVGDEYEVSLSRANVITNAGFAERID